MLTHLLCLSSLCLSSFCLASSVSLFSLTLCVLSVCSLSLFFLSLCVLCLSLSLSLGGIFLLPSLLSVLILLTLFFIQLWLAPGRTGVDLEELRVFWRKRNIVTASSSGDPVDDGSSPSMRIVTHYQVPLQAISLLLKYTNEFLHTKRARL